MPIRQGRAMRRSSGYKWHVVAMLWFVCLFNYADRQAIFSVFPVLKAQFQLTDIQLGYIGSSFMWVYAAMAPLAGLVGDRFRRKSRQRGHRRVYPHERRPDVAQLNVGELKLRLEYRKYGKDGLPVRVIEQADEPEHRDDVPLVSGAAAHGSALTDRHEVTAILLAANDD